MFSGIAHMVEGVDDLFHPSSNTLQCKLECIFLLCNYAVPPTCITGIYFLE
jgi:hypothetical protein